MTLDLPALASPAYRHGHPAGRQAHDIIVPVPDLADYDRVALAWRNDLGVELHVMENGAAWMSEGHVHPSATRNAEARRTGGFLTLLGDPTLAEPMLAQVYTMQRVGGPADAALSVDAPVTVANCYPGRRGRLLRTRGDGGGGDGAAELHLPDLRCRGRYSGLAKCFRRPETRRQLRQAEPRRSCSTARGRSSRRPPFSRSWRSQHSGPGRGAAVLRRHGGARGQPHRL
jgi:hypothetical protein